MPYPYNKLRVVNNSSKQVKQVDYEGDAETAPSPPMAMPLKTLGTVPPQQFRDEQINNGLNFFKFANIEMEPNGSPEARHLQQWEIPTMGSPIGEIELEVTEDPNSHAYTAWAYVIYEGGGSQVFNSPQF